MAPLILMLLILSLRISIADAACNSAAIGGSKFAYTIVVDKFGRGDFTSIQAAIDSISPNNDQWIRIYINPGVYKEKVTIPQEKPCIFFEGRGRHLTIITFDAHIRTDISTTFTFFADNIVAKGLTFENSYNRQLDGPMPDVTQAVAAMILGDMSAFFGCGFLGLQDTLWDARGRHYFYKCYIEGAVDFIFGDGQSIYEDCSINITGGAYSSRLNYGFITAQGRESSDDPGGFVFKQGIIFGTLQSYLGRAYRSYSRVIFQETKMDAEIIPEGWLSWNYPGQEKNFMYAEVNCTGPGSYTSKRVPWEKKLSPSELEQFSISSFINQDGWINRLP